MNWKAESAETQLSLDLGSYLNLFNGIIIVGVSAPTLYMASRIKIAPLKVLFGLFSTFLIIHGVYHLFYFLGDFTSSDFITAADNALEPVSYLILLGFVIYFARRGG